MRINNQNSFIKFKANQPTETKPVETSPAPTSTAQPSASEASAKTKIPTHAYTYSAITVGLTTTAFLIGKKIGKTNIK